MSDSRETHTPGAPIEESEPSTTDVRAAVDRATEASSASEEPAASGERAVPADDPSADTREHAPAGPAAERPAIAESEELPSAADGPTAAEIFAQRTPAESSPQAVPAPPGSSELAQRLEADRAAAETASTDPTAGSAASPGSAAAPAAPATLGPVRDGEIRISTDHPMAALYMQTPMPPDLKGNRGAGVLIALVATLGFALVFAGVLALWIAPSFPPSTFLTEGLLPLVMSWGFIAATAGFFIGLALLVLIAGRAGWWAYVLGGLFVALIVWIAAVVGFGVDARFAGESVVFDPLSLVTDFGLAIPVIAAALVAREATVWFGAWIGARGRRVSRKNAALVAEYEKALAEVQAPKP